MSLMNASGLPEARAAAAASLALLGCGLIFLADVLRELARPVKPSLHHSAEAAPVARAAVRAGAAEPWAGNKIFNKISTCNYSTVSTRLVVLAVEIRREQSIRPKIGQIDFRAREFCSLVRAP